VLQQIEQVAGSDSTTLIGGMEVIQAARKKMR
jgi:hypothetical protein